jgi:hypothetical protein
MKDYKKAIWHVIIISIWINVAETIRWMVFAKPYFLSHTQKMNIEPPSGPLYLIIWLVWGVLLALFIYIISRKFSLIETTIIIWLSVYSGIWIMLFNLSLVTFPILVTIAAFCFIEIFFAALISKYFHNQAKYK